MASFSATLSHHPFSPFPHSFRKISLPNTPSIIPPPNAADPDKDKIVQTANEEPPKPVSATPTKPKKPVYSMKKGQIVRVDKEKYLNSVNYLSVGHPPYYKGLDYIYEDRGEVLDMRMFETGEHALIAWVGIPTAPAWLPTDMLIKSDKLDYERI
ncbi:NAD(P)H-quinone oxidoreductase subunit O, chloroplastic isoform X1 [Magnolia sinica]|uniref:NAD(P)H-quinone oxidoreductase subunit O, chloroplastic isoform X1 n=1 Tax=Magnolia sinica TaxID=86752 RepID=UPI00265AC360|nr:NAD(P)H-quinone oxidoreductase subunit O, chloroplastic isoform X1 [Magnolia sinica]